MGDEPERKASLARVLCGSEGTLAVTREVTLKLVPVPKATMVVAAHFATIDEAMHATVEAVKHGPAAVELLDKRTLDLSRLNLEQERNRWFLEGDPGAILVIEFFDETSEAARARCEGVIAALQAAGLGYAFPIIAPPRINSIWELRKAGLGVLMGSPGDRKPQTLVEDTAVAVADLPAYIAEFAQLMARHQVDCVYYAHASVGELHMRPELDFKQPGDVARAEAIAGDVADLVRKYRGSLSGEHGDGRVRGPYIARVMGPEAYGWLERVKRAFDPAGILNPNNITQTRPMTDDWRYHAQYEHREVASAFAYAESGGLQRAVERCNGAGVCRKTPAMGGTMCPSYMVTGEEHDTTRGRANLFRLMLQQGPEAMFTSPALGEALELCVGCKACKSECPASVDMARLKTEYWAGRYALEGTPLAARAFAEVTEWSRLVQELPLGAAVANWVSGTGLAKAVMAKALGLSEKRTMPAISGSSFHDWFGARKQPSRPGAERVCLFVDEFTDRYEPEVGQAAVAVLEAGGFEVIAPVFAPSGRTYLSRGLVAEAREVIGQNVVALDRLLDDVVAVVGLEPSAVLTYIDESVDFADVPWRAAAERVAKKVKLAEDFVGEVAAREPSRWSWQAEPERVMLHGHCHQKALVGTTGAVAALKASGCSVETIPSGCCGMAGSFGYEAKNYEVSMAMGELVLFPAVRGAESSMQVVASGTSCRHQIHDGTGRSSSHAMVVLAGRLKRR
jgi:Fe-S oxidoreductase